MDIFKKAKKSIGDIVPEKTLASNTVEAIVLAVVELRVLYLKHLNSHWTTGGPSFYGDHQLFERLYKMAQEDTDALAERVIGLAGSDCMKFEKQSVELSRRLSSLGLSFSSAKAESSCLSLLDRAIRTAQDNGDLTHGLDDLLKSISGNRETALYLLKQRGL